MELRSKFQSKVCNKVVEEEAEKRRNHKKNHQGRKGPKLVRRTFVFIKTPKRKGLSHTQGHI